MSDQASNPITLLRKNQIKSLPIASQLQNAPRPTFRPSSLFPKLLSLMRCALHRYELLPPGETPLPLAIALSGGKDSLMMMWALKELSGRGMRTLKIEALHVGGVHNCGAAIGRAQLLSFCDQLEIPLHELKSEDHREKGCYSCARERRRLLFEKVKALGCDVIAFGHHRDDNAQTMLLNMLHGAKPAGMLPKVTMHHYDVTIVRPMILVPESLIISQAKKNNLLRATCICPLGAHTYREKTKKALKELEELFPRAREHLADIALKWGDRGALEVQNKH